MSTASSSGATGQGKRCPLPEDVSGTPETLRLRTARWARSDAAATGDTRRGVRSHHVAFVDGGGARPVALEDLVPGPAPFTSAPRGGFSPPRTPSAYLRTALALICRPGVCTGPKLRRRTRALLGIIVQESIRTGSRSSREHRLTVNGCVRGWPFRVTRPRTRDWTHGPSRTGIRALSCRGAPGRRWSRTDMPRAEAL